MAAKAKSVSLTEAKQAKVLEGFQRLFNLNPCRSQADELAAIYKVIWPSKDVGTATEWGKWAREEKMPTLGG